jgi:hypothetical protein
MNKRHKIPSLIIGFGLATQSIPAAEDVLIQENFG